MVDICKKEILGEVREIIVKVVIAIVCFGLAIVHMANKFYIAGFLWGLNTIMLVYGIEICYDIIKINLRLLSDHIKRLREIQDGMMELIKERSEAEQEIKETKEATNENI